MTEDEYMTMNLKKGELQEIEERARKLGYKTVLDYLRNQMRIRCGINPKEIIITEKEEEDKLKGDLNS